jgi:hypothetical protein
MGEPEMTRTNESFSLRDGGTVTVGSDGTVDYDPSPPDPWQGYDKGDYLKPDEPIFTTLAIGEEGDPDPLEEPIVTTLAIGEENDPDPLPEDGKPPIDGWNPYDDLFVPAWPPHVYDPMIG